MAPATVGLSATVGMAMPAPAWLGRVLIAGGVVIALALFARLMAAPMRHDEQLFFTAGLLFGNGDLYATYGYNHLPNLPILLAAVDAIFPGRPFLTGRVLVFIGWLAAAAIMATIGWRATRSAMIAALAALLLVMHPLLIDRPGTMITNNFLPIPFALGGVLAFWSGVERGRAWLVAVAGFLIAVAMGMKANYVLLIPPFAVAALLVPGGIGIGARLLRVTLPLIAGGILGGLPTLRAFAGDPTGMAAHVFGYHAGPHRAWALQQGGALVISVKDRLMLAQSLWMSGVTLLVALVITVAAVQLWRRGWRPDRRRGWPVLLAAGLTVMGIIVSFAPVPSFPQYFTPPLPFAIVWMVLLVGELDEGERRGIAPLLIAVAALAVVSSGPRLAADLPALARPGQWTGTQIHRVSAEIVAAARGRPVATLSPVHVVEAGGTIYPELAAGPFIYRVADLIRPEDRQHYRLVSRQGLPAMLDADPPGAILVGLEGRLDDGLRDYAVTRGYVLRPLSEPRVNEDMLLLYVRR